MKYINVIGCTFAATLMFVACAEDVTVNGGKEHRIAFDAMTSMSAVTNLPGSTVSKSIEMKADNGSTYYIHVTETSNDESSYSGLSPFYMRGAENTAANLQANGFRVSAYKHASGSAIGTPSFFYDKSVTYETIPSTTNSKYSLPTDYYWPSGSDKLTFYAYYPSSAVTPCLTLSASTLADKQTIEYQVPASAVNQPDLLTAKLYESSFSDATNNGDGSASVPLSFSHALAAIRFKVGTIPNGTINSITLKNIKKHGIYTYAADNSATVGTWSFIQSAGVDDTGDFTLTTSDMASGGVFNASGSTITGTSGLMMMIPQTLGDDAEIEVSYTDAKGGTHTMTGSIKDDEWVAGKIFTYNIGAVSSITSFEAVYPNVADETAWRNGASFVQGLTSNYGVSDIEAFGLFVVNPASKRIVYSNVKMKNGGGASAALTVADGIDNFYFSKDYKYFLYYPYKTNSELEALITTMNYNSFYKQGVTLDVDRFATADNFLQDIVNKWKVEANQSATDLSGYRKSDLQIPSVIDESVDGAKKFVMKHMMGLGIMTLGTKNVYPTYTIYVPSTGGTSGYTGTMNKTITASSKFTGNVPYLYTTDNKYYYIAEPAGRTLSTSSIGIKRWDDFTLSPSAGSYLEKTIPVAWANDFYNCIWMYSYSGNYQTFSTATTGTGNYQMECWGASGGMRSGYSYGGVTKTSGYGGYTKGTIKLIGNSVTLFVYVGGEGDVSHYNLSKTSQSWNNGGWNGGGFSGSNTSSSGIDYTAGGGGATDIRITRASVTGNVWNDFTSLKSRIMVAGGGGGAVYGTTSGSTGSARGGNAGGLIGEDGEGVDSWASTSVTGGKQNAPGTNSAPSENYHDPNGRFGYASQSGNGGPTSWSGRRDPEWWSGGGGGGWYGGAKGGGPAGAGGSSYISGHSGCLAINQSSTSETNRSHLSTSVYNNDSNWAFSGTVMKSGASSDMPKPTTGTGVGWSGNGYAKITFIPIED